MKTYNKSLELVEMVNTKEVVLAQDVRASEGYFRQRYYAGVAGDSLRICEEPMTLPQALFWKEEGETLYVAENAIRLKEKEVREEKTEEKPKPKSSRSRSRESKAVAKQGEPKKDEA